MAVVKVFDANGVKTVELMGNVTDQAYDPEPVQFSEDAESEEEE